MLHLHASSQNIGYNTAEHDDVDGVPRSRREGTSRQTGAYTFNASNCHKCAGVKLTGTGLSTAHMAGPLPNGRGSVNLTFHGTGSISEARGGCGGPAGKKRSGKLIGSMTLKADKLRTVKLHAVSATISTAVNQCHPGIPKGYFLEGFRGMATVYYVNAGKPTPTGLSREFISMTKSGGNGPGARDTPGHSSTAIKLKESRRRTTPFPLTSRKRP